MLGVQPGMFDPMILKITGSGCEDLEDGHLFRWCTPPGVVRLLIEAIDQPICASLSRCEISLACKLSIISSISPSMKRSKL